MPVYLYQCQSCGGVFKKMQTFFHKPLKRCPECNRSAIRRVPQLPAIVFKGSGWYFTDQRHSSGQTKTLNQKNDKAESSREEKSAS